MLIRVIPTGRAELGGLAACLNQLFPAHEFETVAKRVDPDGTPKPYDGFTSCRLELPRKNPRYNLDRLVAALAGEMIGERRCRRAGLVVLLDDLELVNADQVNVVVDCVRGAVLQHIDRLGQHPSKAKVEAELRERASFHLAVPMIESWLFKDPAALTKAGMPDGRRPHLKSDKDPENFETDDPDYSEDDGSACHALIAKTQKHPKRWPPPWVIEPIANMPLVKREHHPKAYLQWLCRDTNDDRNCSSYRESKGGANALAGLNWTSVLAKPEWYSAVRALIGDLEDALGPPALVIPKGPEHPALSLTARRDVRVLRNI